MALSDILAQIEKEASSQIENLEKDFESKMQQLEEKAEQKQKEIDQEIIKQIDDKKQQVMEKAKRLGERESKNQILSAKRAIISSFLEKALQELNSSDKYTEIITEMLKKTDLKEETIMAAKGKEDETKKAIKDSGKDFKLEEKTANIKSGIIIKTGNIEIDNSFQTILKEQLKEELEIKLNKTLF